MNVNQGSLIKVVIKRCSELYHKGNYQDRTAGTSSKLRCTWRAHHIVISSLEPHHLN